MEYGERERDYKREDKGVSESIIAARFCKELRKGGGERERERDQDDKREDKGV